MHSYASSPLLRGTYQDPLTIRRHTASRRGGGQPWGAGLLAPGANASVERASTRASTAPSSSLSMIDSIPAIGLGESIPSLNELSAPEPYDWPCDTADPGAYPGRLPGCRRLCAELLRLLSDVAALMEAGVAAKARELAAVRGEGERLVF